MMIDEEKLKVLREKINGATSALLADPDGVMLYGLMMLDDVDVLEWVVIAAENQDKLAALVVRGQNLHGRIAWLNVYLTLRRQGFGHAVALEATRKTWPDVQR